MNNLTPDKKLNRYESFVRFVGNYSEASSLQHKDIERLNRVKTAVEGLLKDAGDSFWKIFFRRDCKSLIDKIETLKKEAPEMELKQSGEEEKPSKPLTGDAVDRLGQQLHQQRMETAKRNVEASWKHISKFLP